VVKPETHRLEEGMSQQVGLPTARGVTIETSADGTQTTLLFKTDGEPGLVGVVIQRTELARLVSLLLSKAATVAAQTIPEHPPAKMAVTPILASHVAFAQGRADTEALAIFRVGNLDLTFAVHVPMMHAQCTALLSRTRKTSKRKPQ
jgi:hypothetical protein